MPAQLARFPTVGIDEKRAAVAGVVRLVRAGEGGDRGGDRTRNAERAQLRPSTTMLN